MSENTNAQSKNAPKGKGLGRGLGSLLGATEEGAFSKSAMPAAKAVEALTEKIETRAEPAIRAGFVETPTVGTIPEHARIWQIPIEKLNPNPKQPRQNFAKEPLDELANSIREKGVIQPILVRKREDGEFEIIAGERRWRASQLAGLKEVPAVIKTGEDQEILELALIENIQRENLNPVEEAEAYEYLIKKYNLTQNDLARKVGKERTTVTNVLRILQLTPSVRQMVSKGEISLGQAKVLLAVSNDAQQNELANKVRSEQLSVRALEKLVARFKNETGSEKEPKADARTKAAMEVGEELQKLVGSKVTLDYHEGKGRIVIHFYSDEELNQVVDTLRDSWRK